MKALAVIFAALLIVNGMYAAARYAYRHQVPHISPETERMATLEQRVREQQEWIDNHTAVEGDTLGDMYARYQQDAKPQRRDSRIPAILGGPLSQFSPR